MVGCRLLNMIDQRLRAAKKNYDEYFGGINIVFFGDLEQLPPVKDKPLFWDPFANNKTQIDISTINALKLFKEFCKPDTFFSLTKSQRTVENDILFSVQNELRNGTVSDKSIQWLKTRCLGETNPNLLPPKDSTIITSVNSTRNRINNLICQSLNQQKIHFKAQYSLSSSQKKKFSRWSTSRTITLAKDMPVMVLHNFNVSAPFRISNGTMGTVIGISHNEKNKQPHENNVIKIDSFPNYVLIQTQNDFNLNANQFSPNEIPKGAYPITTCTDTKTIRKTVGEKLELLKYNRKQIGLTPSYAVTGHKVQGQTLKAVIIDTSKNQISSARGYLYTILTRVKTGDQLFFMNWNNETELFFRNYGKKFTKQVILL